MTVNELRQKMFTMNMELRKMREEKKELEIAENEEHFQRGMLGYSARENFSFRNNLRLIGTNFQTRIRNEGKVLDSKRDYYEKCKTFDNALQDLKDFYLCNEHLVIIDYLVEQSENGNKDAKRDLTAIFKQNAKKNRNNDY